MQIIDFNSAGNSIVALWLAAVPLIILLVGAWRRKRGKGRNIWSVTRRYRYLPLLIPLLIYYGILYRCLFYNQFYRIMITDSGTWQLEYRLPTRTETIKIANIKDIQAVSGDIWTYKMVRISIFTEDGKRYLSTQISESDKDFFINLLESCANLIRP